MECASVGEYRVRQIVLLLTFGMISYPALAATAPKSAQLRPNWMQEEGCTVSPNASFLSSTTVSDTGARFLDRTILDPGFANSLRQEYEDKTRDFEMKQKYGLLDTNGVAAYNNALTDVRKDLVKGVRQTQARDYGQNANTAARNGEVSTPMIVTGSLASFYFGNALDVTVVPEMRLWARTDVRNQTSEFKIFSPIGESSVQMDGSDYAKMGLGADGLPIPDPSGVRHERYKVAVSRSLPLWDLSSAVSYGGTSSTVHASIAKPIVNNVTAAVETIQPMAAAAAAGAPSEQIFRVLYGITF